MNNRKQVALTTGLLSLFIFGSVSFVGLRDRCIAITQAECVSLWGLFSIAVLGGIILIETLGKNQKQRGDQINTKTEMSATQIGTRSIARIILSTFLLGLPILFQGAYIATIGGLTVGLSLDIIYRGLTNKFSTNYEDGHSNESKE